MRFLYFHQHFATPRGSGGTRSYAFARELVRRGHHVTLVCGRGGRGELDLPRDGTRGWRRGWIDGIEVVALPVEYSNHMGLARRLWAFLRFAVASLWVAVTEECDVVFATSTPLTAALPGVAARWLRGRRFVFEVRDLWPELPRAMGLRNPILISGMWLLEGLAYRSAHACIGLAPGIVEGIRRRSPRGRRIAMIPNGCDLDIFAPAGEAKCAIPGIPPGSFVAGFAGAHGLANGLDAVLDCARELRRRGEDRIRIVLVGDGSEKARLVGRARSEGLDHVHFLDPVPKTQLAGMLASMDCGLMVLANIPAFYQGTSPNKFFDYIASGIPVVINYPGWIADLVTTAPAGLAVEPGDAGAMADALQRLAQGDGVEAMRRGAMALAAERFSRDRLAGEFAAFVVGVGAGGDGQA